MWNVDFQRKKKSDDDYLLYLKACMSNFCKSYTIKELLSPGEKKHSA